VIENIKHLRSELHIKAIRDPRNRKVLENGEINVDQARPDYRVAAQIAEQIRTIDNRTAHERGYP
jgi:hypothetical protein